MGKVIRFEDHALTPSRRSRALKAKTDGSIGPSPIASTAAQIRTKCWGGIPRVRQWMTPGAVTPTIAAVLVGPPSTLITASTDLIMKPFTSQIVNKSRLHASAVESPLGVTSNADMEQSVKVLARRLKLTREALELSAAEVCKRIDCAPNRWSQYEGGQRPITIAVAIAMCEEFGLSLDWIYRGDPQRLPHDLRLKMRQAA
jgi:DNA-binding XRE family transcriptional regulator